MSTPIPREHRRQLETLGNRVAAVRKERKLSQAELARLAGVAPGTIGNLESGTRKAPRELLALADALGISPQWLKTGKGPIETDAAAPSDHQKRAVPKYSLLDAARQIALAMLNADRITRELVARIIPDLILKPEACEVTLAMLARVTQEGDVDGRGADVVHPE